MKNKMNNKYNWRSDGGVEYICIEIRPPRRKTLANKRAQIRVDWMPGRDSGAYEAFQALIDAVIANGSTPETAMEFYNKLREFADSNLGDEGC